MGAKNRPNGQLGPIRYIWFVMMFSSLANCDRLVQVMFAQTLAEATVICFSLLEARKHLSGILPNQTGLFVGHRGVSNLEPFQCRQRHQEKA